MPESTDLRKRAGGIVRGREVLLASLVLAAASALLVPPNSGYADYIDWRTLSILFCFMACVAGIRSSGVFEAVASRMLERVDGTRDVCAILVLLPAVFSMFVTNDVALLTFVPFAVFTLDSIGRRDLIAWVLVLQTLAANLGCMVLPFGSPHNIFIDSFYSPDLAGFMSVTLPLAAAGFVLLAILVFFRRDSHLRSSPGEAEKHPVDRPTAVFMTVLFIISVAAVLRIVPYPLCLIAVVLSIAVFRPRVLLQVDYGLLATFVLLFVFAGNISSIGSVHELLASVMASEPVLGGIVVSQIMSNVPAAVMLSGFTADWRSMLVGINIGGFGTLIASMASVITFRIYSQEKDAETGSYLVLFTVLNIAMIVVLVAAWMLLLRSRSGIRTVFLLNGVTGYQVKQWQSRMTSSRP